VEINVNSEMSRDEVIGRLHSLADHHAPEKLDRSKDAVWREACLQAAIMLSLPPEEADITPKVQDLVFAARRVWKKYGHDEVGIESDWTEWVDLRDALDAISPMNVCGQAETPSQEEK
jgi:microsomal dipeptidase-like Zn-dependent dipeptidase